MIHRSISELDAFARLSKCGRTYDRVYPTNACAGPSLHDTIMDAPLGSMADSVWHSWSHSRKATRTLFHVFQNHEFHTRLFGAFGLDPRLDPHSHMHMNPDKLSTALSMYGIDECDAQDAAYTCQLGFAHDRDVIERVKRYLADKTHTDAKRFLMVNLLGCQDAHKCTFSDVDPEKVCIPVMHFEGASGDYDERIFSRTVLSDNARQRGTHAHEIEPLRRSAQLKDWISGATDVDLGRDDTIRTVTGLHRFCWKCIDEINSGVSEILSLLESQGRLEDAVIYLYSDHAISLYEHGELCEAPWDSCMRSFMIRKSPCANGDSRQQLSLSSLPTMLMADCGIHADWHVVPSLDDCCITLGLAISWLARAYMPPRVSSLALQTFFVRANVLYNHRHYGVTMWFSLDDLMTSSVTASRMSRTSRAWKNPTLHVSFETFAKTNLLQVYEHLTDPYESDNIARHADWLKTECATNLKKIIDASMLRQELATLALTVPDDVDAISPDKVTFCSVQLHHRIRDRVRGSMVSRPVTTSSGTQTDEITLAMEVTRAFGETLGSAICSTLKDVRASSLTLFVPDGPDLQAWAEWAPSPFGDIYTRERLLDIARRQLSIRDVTGTTHRVTTKDDENILLSRCRISLRTAVVLTYADGLAIAYRVFHAEAALAGVEQLVLSSPRANEEATLDGVQPAVSPGHTTVEAEGVKPMEKPDELLTGLLRREADGEEATEETTELLAEEADDSYGRIAKRTSRQMLQRKRAKIYTYEGTTTKGSVRAMEFASVSRTR